MNWSVNTVSQAKFIIDSADELQCFMNCGDKRMPIALRELAEDHKRCLKFRSAIRTMVRATRVLGQIELKIQKDASEFITSLPSPDSIRDRMATLSRELHELKKLLKISKDRIGPPPSVRNNSHSPPNP